MSTILFNYLLILSHHEHDLGRTIIVSALLLVFIIYFSLQQYSLEGKQRFKRFKFDPDNEIINSILDVHLPYYAKLGNENKKAFRIRLCRFLRTTRFAAVPPLELSPQMAIRIAATFTQITFGMRKNMLDIFIDIKIHPEHYFNERTKKFHKGEVDTSGIIQLSWEDFTKGFAISDDGYNLGIHEMAHALALELLDERQTYAELMPALRNVFMIARNEIKDKNQRSELLRHYAYVNIQEYFAVATEAFFESPFKMQEQHPELFDALCRLFGQKPINILPA